MVQLTTHLHHPGGTASVYMTPFEQKYSGESCQ